MPDRRLIANAVLFQLSWLACVLGGNSYWLAVPAVALLIHFFWVSSWAAEGKLVVSVMLAGAALDSFLLQLGVFTFVGQELLAPLWLAMLWAMLATTLNHSLGWTARPIWRAALLGAIGGPLSYVAGAELADQFRHKLRSISLYHPVQISNAGPRAVAALIKKLITDDPANQCQTGHAE